MNTERKICSFDNSIYGKYHIHSNYSLKDGAQTLSSLVDRCGELNAKGIVLTDHGVLTGFKDFVDTVSSYNEKHGTDIKAIPGCELYYEEDNDLTHRKHLVIVPLDNVGFNAMCNIVTESNKRLDSKDFPRVNTEILERFAGPGSLGHGHVIASSACVNGVIASVLLENDYINKQLASLNKKIARLSSPESISYKKNSEKLIKVQQTIEKKKAEQQAAAVLAKKPYKKKEKAVAALLGTPEYDIARAALDKEMQESKEAKEAIEILKEEVASLKVTEKRLKEAVKDEAADHQRWAELKKQIDYLESQRLSSEELIDKARSEVLRFETIFGKGNFYLEIQNHRLPSEIEVYPIIASLSEELNIPLVAANDEHVTYNSPDEFKRRQIIRSLRFNKWEEMDESDKEVYIKTDKELSAILLEIIPEKLVIKAFNGIKEIIDRCNLSFEKVNHYPKFTSSIPGETAEGCLIRLANQGIEWRYPNREGWTPTHQERLEYELKVIKQLDVCDYLCIVEDFLRYGRLLGKIDIESEEFKKDPYNFENLERLAEGHVGLGIGPGRGSAVGSLVCYLIGITGIDPMKYSLLFERFLNTERVTMPDIDSDFKPDIRGLVLDYVKYKYGVSSVCQIMTKQTQAARGAVRNCARLLGSERSDDTRQFLSLGDKIAKEIPTKIGITLSDCWDSLMETFKDNPDAIEILNNAKLVEGGFTTIGLHAAAVIISDDKPVSEYLPLLYNTDKEQWACQINKDEAEAAGMLKMDFLGLRNLGIITETLNLIVKTQGKHIDITNVPFEDKVFEKIFITGNTHSVFQFESGGMRTMLRQFKPSSIEDIILLVAAYRPGPMQYLDDIIAVKNGQKLPDYVIPEMEEVLGTTYGKPVYQEQIQQIFNKFAGFTLGEADIIRRYMSKKKTDKFMVYKDKFINGLIASGAQREKAEDFWTQLVEFSKYAFNKSHAAAYAFVAYYTAYLKCYYPVEYFAAVMNDSPFKKLGTLINECRLAGITVLPPRINESEDVISVSADGSSVIYGLGLVKDVGSSAKAIVAERNENGRFTSFADFMLRTKCRKDVAESLIKAGAFDEFSKSRAALLFAMPDYCDCIKTIGLKKKVLLDENKSEVSKKNAQRAIEDLLVAIQEIEYDSEAEENIDYRLQQEKETTSAYITGHPLDSYPSPSKIGATPIDAIHEPLRFSTVFGIIKNLRETNRKSDGAKLAFFELEDLTGTIKVNCFTKAYAANKDLIFDDSIVKISGEISAETIDTIDADGNETYEQVFVINANKLELVESVKPKIIIEVASVMDWFKIQDELIGYWDNSGHELFIKDALSGRIRKTTKKISAEILSSDKFVTYKI